MLIKGEPSRVRKLRQLLLRAYTQVAAADTFIDPDLIGKATRLQQEFNVAFEAIEGASDDELTQMIDSCSSMTVDARKKLFQRNSDLENRLQQALKANQELESLVGEHKDMMNTLRSFQDWFQAYHFGTEVRNDGCLPISDISCLTEPLIVRLQWGFHVGDDPDGVRRSGKDEYLNLHPKLKGSWDHKLVMITPDGVVYDLPNDTRKKPTPAASIRAWQGFLARRASHISLYAKSNAWQRLDRGQYPNNLVGSLDNGDHAIVARTFGLTLTKHTFESACHVLTNVEPYLESGKSLIVKTLGQQRIHTRRVTDPNYFTLYDEGIICDWIPISQFQKRVRQDSFD